MPRWLKATLGFLGGLVVGEALAITGYIVATNFLGLHDRDGGGAMGAIFMIGPVLALLCGVLFAFVAAGRKPTSS